MMMKEFISKGYEFGDTGPSVYDDYARLYSAGAEVSHDPYRCPVSTPAGTHRKNRDQPPPTFVTFTNLNRSLQIPKHISSPKHSNYKTLLNKRNTSKPQKKNFDCYFVKKIDKKAHIDAQTQSTWLSSLCSQPVNEIFGKYKRKTEASNVRNTMKSRNISTPGEKALMSAWSSNASSRGIPSALSRSETVSNSRMSSVDPSLRVYGYENDQDQQYMTHGFALMPVSPSQMIYDDDNTTTVSSRVSMASPMSLKHPKNVSNLNFNASFSEPGGRSSAKVLRAFQRDQRFPEIRPRKGTMSPTKKQLAYERTEQMSPITSPRQCLVESPMQIFSLGALKSDIVPPATACIQKSCTYRLPTSLSASQASEWHGKG